MIVRVQAAKNVKGASTRMTKIEEILSLRFLFHTLHDYEQ